MGDRKFKSGLSHWSEPTAISAISQAMSCLYVGSKKTPTDSKSDGGNKSVGTAKASKPSMGIDGSLDVNLMCRYCKDTGHDLDNCKWLQQKLAHEHAAMQSTVTQEMLNTNHH